MMHTTISVFFSGTSHRASDSSTLVYLLKKYLDIKDSQREIAFDGCGLTHGNRGVIFGSGLDEQCQEVIQQVREEIEKGNSLTLNVYGHSRGGSAALMLAKQLSEVAPNLLEINLALLDPVPGNLITTSTLDFFDISLAKKTMDLRGCKPLKRVLALYPHEPLPIYAVHAPSFSLYPEHTAVEEEVIAGCHAGAQFQRCRRDGIFFDRDSFITFARVFQFLRACGTQFKPLPTLNVCARGELKIDEEQLDQTLLAVYQAENVGRGAKSWRDVHSATGRYINTKDNAAFFNLNHQRLAGVPEDKSQVRLTIEEKKGPISRFKRAILHYPKIWQALKWSSLAMAVASLIFFTGGIGALPLLAGLTAQLGLLTIPALAPLVGLTLVVLWYGLAKPLSQGAINRFFYPQFSIRSIQPRAEQIVGTPLSMLVALGGSNCAEQTRQDRPIANGPMQKDNSCSSTPLPREDNEEEYLLSL